MAQHAAEFTRHVHNLRTKTQDASALQAYAVSTATKAQVVQTPPLDQCRFFSDFNSNLRIVNLRVQTEVAKAVLTHGKAHVRNIPCARCGGLAYYRLYSDDMPVYITADSILHAWHRSFDEFLIDVEQDMMMPILDNVLRSALTECEARYNSPELDATAPGGAHARQLLLRIDFFLAIALSLLAGEESFGLSDNDARVTTTWQLIQRQEMVETEIFGATRHVDFSQFKPRGHYAKTKKLQHYFQAMMWVGTVDFRIAGGEDADQDLFQLQCALVLMDVLRQTRKLSALETLDACISSLVADGDVDGDCMSPMQFQALIPADIADLIKPLADVDSKQALLKLQATIIDGCGVRCARQRRSRRLAAEAHEQQQVRPRLCSRWTAVVVDAHTDTPSVEYGDPGSILHWDVNFGLFTVDGVTYAGPVFSNYEFVTPINKRLNDDEFAKKLSEVLSPSWATDSYMCDDGGVYDTVATLVRNLFDWFKPITNAVVGK